MIESQRNWAGNHIYRAARLHRPETLAQVQALVAACRQVKALGARHSFNAVADTRGDLISLEHLDRVVAIDRERHTVTVEAGIRYGTLAQQLHREGFALHNLASLPHISVAGACATGTHGSGDRHGNLATAVAAIEIVTAGGDVIALSRERDGDRFAGAVVALGALGVVTKLTLDIVPTFDVRQDVYEHLPFEQLEANFDAIVGSAYSVSLFTDWRDAQFNQVWVKRCVTDGAAREVEDTLYEATAATRKRHPIDRHSAENCTEQRGVPGPWYERLPHFRMEFTPSSGAELQTEYLVPRPHARAALRAINAIRAQVAPLLQISEVRTIAADMLWMSPCYAQACIALHFTWIPDWPAVSKALPLIEEQLAPLGARPHWGKLFTMSPAYVQSCYPQLPDFRALLHDYDPTGKFRNAFLDTYLFGTQ